MPSAAAVVPLGIEPKVWSNAATTRKSSISGYKPGMMVLARSRGDRKSGFYPVHVGGDNEGGGKASGKKVENKMVTATAEVMEREKERRQDPEVPVIGDVSMDISAVSTTPKISTSRKRKASVGSGKNKKTKTKVNNVSSKKKKNVNNKKKKSRLQQLVAARNRQRKPAPKRR